MTKAIEVEVSIDAPQQMIGRDVLIEAKVVKQPSRCRLNPHHRRLSRIQTRQRITALPSHQSTANFFNNICAFRPCAKTRFRRFGAATLRGHIGKRGLTNVRCKRWSVNPAMALASATEKTNVGAMTAYYAINWTIAADGISLGPRKWRD